MRDFRATPMEMVASLWHNRNLILQMSRREVIGRYRGSVMGLAWSFFNPLLMLSVYTFVFSVVFKMRWGGGGRQPLWFCHPAVRRHDRAWFVCRMRQSRTGFDSG